MPSFKLGRDGLFLAGAAGALALLRPSGRLKPATSTSIALVAQHVLRQIQGKAVGIVELKCYLARADLSSRQDESCARFRSIPSRGRGLAKSLLFCGQTSLVLLRLDLEFGIGVAHTLRSRRCTRAQEMARMNSSLRPWRDGAADEPSEVTYSRSVLPGLRPSAIRKVIALAWSAIARKETSASGL